MPTQSRWLIKTALGYLAAALTIGLVRAVQAAGMLPGTATALWLPQLHFLTVGWLTQLIFGVASWLFPNPKEGRAPSRVVWAAYGALNAGLVLRLVCEPRELPQGLSDWGLVVSAALQWGASLLFVGHFWRRVQAK